MRGVRFATALLMMTTHRQTAEAAASLVAATALASASGARLPRVRSDRRDVRAPRLLSACGGASIQTAAQEFRMAIRGSWRGVLLCCDLSFVLLSLCLMSRGKRA